MFLLRVILQILHWLQLELCSSPSCQEAYFRNRNPLNLLICPSQVWHAAKHTTMMCFFLMWFLRSCKGCSWTLALLASQVALLKKLTWCFLSRSAESALCCYHIHLTSYMYILQWIISLQIYTNDKKLSSAPVAVMCATKPRSSRALAQRRSLWLRWKQPPRSRSGRILHRILCNRSLLSVIIIERERNKKVKVQLPGSIGQGHKSYIDPGSMVDNCF